MKTIIRIHLLSAIWLFALTGISLAQQMPQDNWRYDGLEFSAPDPAKPLHAIAIGSGGVYVGYGSPATSIVQFQETGVFIREFGTFGSIAGIACASNGDVFVLDSNDSKIKAYDQNGLFLREWGGPGTGDGQFGPGSGDTMLAVDKNNQIYACDPGNTRIQVFDTNGNFLRKWGEQGNLPSQFKPGSPNHIAASPKGLIYTTVYDRDNPVRVFTPQGVFVRGFVVPTPYGDGGVTGLATTPDGLACTGDAQSSSLQISKSEGGQIVVIYPTVNYNYGERMHGRSFSKTGNLCGIMVRYYANGTYINPYIYTVRILEREYSNVRNSLLPPAIPQPMIQAVAQREGTTWLDVDYEVVDTDSTTVTTAALAFLNGNNTLTDVVPMRTFREGTGSNIGANTAANTQKRITWDMAADWSVDYAQIQVEVLAKDNRNPLGVHWITVPVSGSDPAIEVSKDPVTDAALLDLWYWFVASQTPGTSFANGKVMGTSGLYNGQSLASGTATTIAGRLFATEYLGMRPITWPERNRALAGNYGFSSVSQNTVVREVTAMTSFVRILGAGTSYSEPPQGASTSGTTRVAGGDSHSLFAKGDGTLWALGQNSSGQLGDGTTTHRDTAMQVATEVGKVAAGGGHSLFVKTDGTLWAMGNNGNGQLGDGTTTNRSLPVHIADNVAQVACGSIHSLFVKTNGELWAMGYNYYGQLGNGTITNSSVPVHVADNVAQVVCGGYHSLFVKTNNELWAMGFNNYGQLGDGTNTNRSTPVHIADNVARAACGGNHSLFVKTNGELWAMGNNERGQLGNGSTAYSIPAPFLITSSVSKAAAGSTHSLFVKTNGSLWAMGGNQNDQLGDGTTTDRLLPLQVESHVGEIACGGNHSLVVITAP